jgi:Mg2+ and Co2+ transporter CorA
MDLNQYAIQEGMTSRLIPAKNPYPEKDYVNTSVAFDNMINKFGYRGLDNPKAYYNEDYRGFVQNHRSALNSLAQALLDEADEASAKSIETITKEGNVIDKKARAKQTLDFSLERMPDKAVPYDLTMTTTVELYFRLGEREKALSIAKTLVTRAEEMINYLIKKESGVTLELRKNMFVIGDLQRVMLENGERELADQYEKMYQKHITDLGQGQ